MIYAQTLKSLLADALRAKKVLSRKEVHKIALENGYEVSNAERRLRAEKYKPLPVIKLNRWKKPAKESEHIMYFKWGGGRTFFKV